ncbi:MAG: class I SAM-dependent methyltransferase [Candidatus Margulisiibacteriota bacterium]
MENEYLKKQNEFFTPLLKKHGYSVSALHWGSEASQNQRFIELLKIFSMVDTAGAVSLLDMGCGLGHLYKFLKVNGLLENWKIDYTGVDINEAFLKEAGKQLPEAKFRIKDASIYEEKFDIVLCSGIFNLRFSRDFDIRRYYTQELSRLFNASRRGVAVNFQSREGISLIPRRELGKELERFYFHDDNEVMQDLSEITSDIRISRGYLPNDFTVYLLH